MSRLRLAEVRRKALRTPGPYAYERFLAARGLTAIDPASALTPFVLDFLFEEHRRAGSRDSTGARDNIRVANAALSRLVQTGDRGVLNTLERELATARPGTADLLRAMAVAKPPPDHFVRTLVIESEAPDAEVVATAYQLMGKLDASADLTEWVPQRRAHSRTRGVREVPRAHLAMSRGRPRLACRSSRASRRATRRKPYASPHLRPLPAPATQLAIGPHRCWRRRSRPRCRHFDRCSRANVPGRSSRRPPAVCASPSAISARSATMYLEALKQNPDLVALGADPSNGHRTDLRCWITPKPRARPKCNRRCSAV